MLKTTTSLVFLIFLIWQGNAETLFINDGRIFVGTITSASGGQVELNSFGRKVTLSALEILRTETDQTSLNNMKVEAVLKDSSKIRGKIVNFDADIGLFLDIGFGIVTLPVASIEDLYDSSVQRNYEGAQGTVFAGGTLNWPPLNTDYGLGYSGLLRGEWRTPWLRGFYLGASLEANALNYTRLTTMKYSLLHLSVEATYKYLGFRSVPGILSLLAPFVTVGLGPSVILVADNRPGIFPNRYGSLASHAGLTAGLEVGPWDNVSVRVFGDSTVTFQSDQPFTTIGAGLSVGYSF